eukprot:m.5253 g.5253  ORF g.5253 m.5253 type:complete len:601 (+) comp12617_c0_seq1:69-1871(+)
MSSQMASESEREEKKLATGPRADDEDEDKQKTLNFVTSDCAVRSVVVFRDRAEVCRVVEANVPQGDSEILLTSLPSTIDEESIRVEGFGAVSINEVAFVRREEKSEPIKEEADTAEEPDEVRRMKTNLEKLRKDKEGVSDELRRTKEQRVALHEFADNVVDQAKGRHLSELVSGGSLDGIGRFHEMYDTQSTSLDESMIDLEGKDKELEEKIQIEEKKLRKKKPVDSQPHVEEIRELSVLLHAEEPGSIELHISYVVTNAKWTPQYDIRVESETKNMEIVYFGVIEQSTGEDWKDAKLSLSTAMPSVGGSAPELATRHLRIVHASMAAASLAKSASLMKKSSGFSLRGSFRKKKKERRSNYRDSDSDSDDLQLPSTVILESITSATYEVKRKTTIPSDKTGHKVSIDVIPLKPEFEHESAPRLSAHAFLKAKVKNSSRYAFLPGQANVFLDGNFITKSSVSAVSPGEEFGCFLGADRAVKVTYKPFREYQIQTGIVSKSSVVIYHQIIGVQNTRSDVCKIKVSDQLPRSTEDRIKVKLVEPEIRKPEHGQMSNPRLNEFNNIEWDLMLKPNDKRELTFKYSVDSPFGKKIEEKTVSSLKK